MKSVFVLVMILLLFTNLIAKGETESFNMCPLCSNQGELICPLGFEAACQNETPGDTEPKCILLEKKYMPGCWKFVGIKKLNLDFSGLMLSPTAMIEVIGGGETYTLNRDIVGCRKL